MYLCKQMSSRKCSFTCIFGSFWPLNPLRPQFKLGLHFTPACLLLSVCSLHFTHRLHFTPGPQSAVRSPQSAFDTDRFQNYSCQTMLYHIIVFLSFISHPLFGIICCCFFIRLLLIFGAPERERDSRFNILCVVCTHYSISSIHYSVSCTHCHL